MTKRSVNGNVLENDDVEDINKSVVVIGGFIGKALEEAETMVQQMMIGIAGTKAVEMIDNTPPIALATFESPIAGHEIHPSPEKECYRSDQKTLGIKKSI